MVIVDIRRSVEGGEEREGSMMKDGGWQKREREGKQKREREEKAKER